MSNKKQDQFNATHNRIKNCFRELLLTSDLSDITVVKLSNTAGISRKTFYLHYQTIDELMDDIITSIFQTLLHTMKDLASKGKLTPYYIAQRLNEVIYQDYDFHMRMLCINQSHSIAARIQSLWLENSEILKFMLPSKSEKEAQVLLYGFANGLLSMYAYVYLNKIEMTVDQIAKLLENITPSP